MTVITKALGEKKSDNLEEPLVDNIVVEPNDEAKKADLESGGYPVPPPQNQRYIISARVRPYYSLMFILMLVLLITTSLLGIFGTEYLYEQYRYLVGSEQQPYRTWGTVSFNENPTAMAYENNKIPVRFEKSQENVEQGIFSEILSHFGSNDVASQEMKDESIDRPNEINIKEEFELDLSNDRYEKINVPSGEASRFIHDFYSNYTAIVDEKNKRCFVMPLDRSVILPPKSLYDLLFKMQDGYYSIDTERVRREMQVVQPAIDDLESYGIYIAKECYGFTSYKLEKFVGGVVKRSVSDSSSFKFFIGDKLVEFDIEGIPPSNVVAAAPEAVAMA
ncbi:integral membrane protein 2A isoform X2 [Planococcus citri]|uniref:integral membrane protein 2A isoform X2 n=1 Tax=Planococcus citri TaxID=170843 RepID=UPI0031FA077A